MNPFLAPDFEKALEALTRGPMTSNQHGVLIRPVDQLAEAVRALHGKVATAKAEGAAEAYEAEAQEWTEQAVRARHTYVDPTPGRTLERRAVEARERAAAIRKGIEAKEGK